MWTERMREQAFVTGSKRREHIAWDIRLNLVKIWYNDAENNGLKFQSTGQLMTGPVFLCFAGVITEKYAGCTIDAPE
jgi:hypothetical protein